MGKKKHAIKHKVLNKTGDKIAPAVLASEPEELTALKKKFGGRPVSFATPEEMGDKAAEYFYERLRAVIGFGKDGKEIRGQGPISIGSCCDFMGISDQTFENYSQKPDFAEICAQIRQKCKGAAEDKCMSGKDHKADFILANGYGWNKKVEGNSGIVNIIVADEKDAEALKEL